ncbi:MAG TPA: GxxExxY protein [Vicinamibacterales bacterium]|nr:GxxExxY protein [Vicinamibacterales bacterium]
MSIELASPLPLSTEALVTRIIGCAIEVHRRVGPGFLEAIYEDALAIELEWCGMRFDRQREIIITYRDRPLRPHRVDLVIEDQVIVEVKAVEALHSLHRAQLISYLRATRLRVGLLINFNAKMIKGNFQRVVV